MTDVIEKVLTNKKYKKQIDRLSNRALEILANDPIKAMEAAYKGVSKVEPEKAKDLKYLQDQADAMQKLAKGILAKRNKNI